MHMGRPSGARPLRQVARRSRQRPTQPGRRHQIPMGLTCGDDPRALPATRERHQIPMASGARGADARTVGRRQRYARATGAARRDRPQITGRNPGTDPKRRGCDGRAARSSGGVRVASAASGARGPTERPCNRTPQRRRLRRDEVGRHQLPMDDARQAAVRRPRVRDPHQAGAQLGARAP